MQYTTIFVLFVNVARFRGNDIVASVASFIPAKAGICIKASKLQVYFQRYCPSKLKSGICLESGFTFYRARGVVKGLALDTGLTVVTLDLEAKGGGLDEDKAVRKALGNLAKRLEHEFGPALEGVLE